MTTEQHPTVVPDPNPLAEPHPPHPAAELFPSPARRS